MTSKKSGTGWPSAPTSRSAVSAQRVAKKKKTTQPNPTPNKFQNDGSFMEKFKKIAEQKQQQQQHASCDQTEASSSTSVTQKESDVESDCLPATTYLAPQTITYRSGSGEDKMALKRPQQGIIGKRKNLLKTNELREKRKKRRGELEEQQSAELADQKSSAWKSYMAEVKAYEARNCGDSDDHKRPLVK